jgi:outer membrane protein insertion porin family
MRKKIVFLLLFITTIFFLFTIASYAQELPVINAIEIEGLKRIEESAVKAKITQMIGETLSQEKTNEDIKNIFKMGYFDDVRAEIEPFEGGVRLLYVVKEKPIITKIEFQGNKKFKDSKLREKITISTGSIADVVLVQDNANKLRAFYEEEGYWLSQIVPVIKTVAPDEVTLTYQIAEGPKVRVKGIVIEGNQALSRRKIKGAMKTKKWWMFSFITSAGYFQKEQMDLDIERIKDLYYNNGYINVVVGEPKIQLTENKKGMIITISVSEGDQFTVSSVDIAHNEVFSDEEIMKRVTMVPGKPFSKETLSKDIYSISELYSENGYALVTVLPDIRPDEETKSLELVLNIEEGDKYRIGRIEISGNTKTRDKVIRREIRLDEGDVFNSALIRRSYERLGNLNYFESVDISPEPQLEKKLVDLDVKVKDKPTGFLSVGGGYSSVEKFIAMVDVTQANLFGKGYYLKVRAELGGRTTYFDVTFRDPWFLDKPLSFSTNIYKMNREYFEYTKKATGFGISIGKNFSEYWWGTLAYNFEDAEITDVSVNASNYIKDQEGKWRTSSITPSLIRDSRDNYIDPMRGSRNSVYVTYAGLGGTNRFIKSEFDSAWFFPIGKTSIMLRGRVGYGSGVSGRELPLYERFYLGGIYSVRGIDWGDAGPIDSLTNEPVGGKTELIFNAEYIFPVLPSMNVKGVVFADAGNSYDSSCQCDYDDFPNCSKGPISIQDTCYSDKFGTLRYTTGLGVRWISPFGPIRLEWGYNLDKRDFESQSRIEFAFGTFF